MISKDGLIHGVVLHQGVSQKGDYCIDKYKLRPAKKHSSTFSFSISLKECADSKGEAEHIVRPDNTLPAKELPATEHESFSCPSNLQQRGVDRLHRLAYVPLGLCQLMQYTSMFKCVHVAILAQLCSASIHRTLKWL